MGEPINSSLSLGCNGTVVVRFVDNTLVDIEGPDLYVFEIGPEVESTQLAISNNGKDWIDIGPIEGSTAAIDISEFTTDPSASFEYVRLTDRNIKCRAGNYSGADIDAVGAIGAAIRFTLSGSVLFDFDSAQLKAEAIEPLNKIADTIASLDVSSVTIEGHTDSQGSDDYNLTLSSERAGSVLEYFQKQNLNVEFRKDALGESRPVADNQTEEGRAANRRVEVIVVPKK